MFLTGWLTTEKGGAHKNCESGGAANRTGPLRLELDLMKEFQARKYNVDTSTQVASLGNEMLGGDCRRRLRGNTNVLMIKG